MTDAERRQRIEDICHAALDQPVPDRPAFVAAACEDDDALRLEVERLLSHAQTAERFLATPIGVVAAQVLVDEGAAVARWPANRFAHDPCTPRRRRDG